MALEVNGELIEDAVIRREAQVLKPRYADVFAGSDALTAEMQLRELAREQVVERVLLQQDAAKNPDPVPAEAIEQGLDQIRQTTPGGSNCITPMNESTLIEDVTRQLRLDRLIGTVISKVSAPRHKEVVEYYRKHLDEFEAPEMVRAAHIVKNVDENNPEAAALAAMEEIRAKLDSGASFSELADMHSDCPGSGGDLGYFARGQMVEEFDDVVFDLEVGQTSPVFRTPFGFHLAHLIDRKPAGVQPLDTLRGTLENKMHRMKQQRALHDYVQRLKAKAQIRELKNTPQSK